MAVLFHVCLSFNGLYQGPFKHLTLLVDAVKQIKMGLSQEKGSPYYLWYHSPSYHRVLGQSVGDSECSAIHQLCNTQLTDLSEPQFLHPENETNNSCHFKKLEILCKVFSTRSSKYSIMLVNLKKNKDGTIWHQEKKVTSLNLCVLVDIMELWYKKCTELSGLPSSKQKFGIHYSTCILELASRWQAFFQVIL